MKKYSLLLLSLLPAMALADKVELRTPNNSFVVELNKGAEPQFLYYGPSLKSQDIENLEKANDANWSRADLYPA